MRGDHLILDGCTPAPLASYLKALAVLRLISSPGNHVSGQAADPHARGWWEDERFHLQTTLSRDGLLRFFLHDYAPSPLIAAWNGRAGFLEGDGAETSTRTGAVLVRSIANSRCARLGPMRQAIDSLRDNKHISDYNRLRAKAKAEGVKEKKASLERQARATKSLLLPSLRAKSDERHVDYIDSCYVLAADETTAPLLGSGGNDGSRDFGVNFAEHLMRLFNFDDGRATDHGTTEIHSAVFDIGYLADANGSMGQFSPGHSGPNATTGYGGSNPLNSWDVVLAMEGTLVFMGALTRRWGVTGSNRAAFPFTFEPSNAGAGGLASEEPNQPRGEIWTPLWRKPAAFAEVRAMFSEGRLTVGSRTARTGLDAARSVARLGASRGISGFERYSLVQPDRNLQHQATPLGRFNTPARPCRDIVADLDAGDWLERVRRLAGNRKSAPARARQAVRRLDDALFRVASTNRTYRETQEALTALGGLVAWLTTSREALGSSVPPPPLSSEWIRQADDGSPEFRVAVALASIGLPPAGHAANIASTQSMIAPPMAAHLAPIDESRFFHRGRLSQRRAWATGDTPPTVVWGGGNLVSNVVAVLERRLVEASIRGLADKPLAAATWAQLSDVAAFLLGDFDDSRCAALLAGLVWAKPGRLRSAQPVEGRQAVPFAYAALKPIFTPNSTLQEAEALPEQTGIPVPPGIVASLRSGAGSSDGHATNTAVRMALARARASGLQSPFDLVQFASRGTRQGSLIGTGIAADRLAAALLVPIGTGALNSLIRRAYPKPDDDNPTTEDPTHVH